LQHFSLSIQKNEGMIMLVLIYKREFVKDYHYKQEWQVPVHAFYNIYTESVLLLFNFILYFLSLAGGDDAFQEHKLAEEILDNAD
jgi:carbonic anhydrase